MSSAVLWCSQTSSSSAGDSPPTMDSPINIYTTNQESMSILDDPTECFELGWIYGNQIAEYRNWIYGPELPDSFFAPGARVELERVSYAGYKKRVGRESIGPAPVLYSDLLHGRD